MNFYPVVPVSSDWDRLRDGVASALEQTPNYERLTFDEARKAVESRRYLWLVCEHEGEIIADFLTTISVEDGTRVLMFPIMFGKRMDEWLPHAKQMFEQYARHNGCARMRMVTFKPGIARMYDKLFNDGWTHVHLFEKEVSNG